MNALLDAALAYAERGWHVVPCDGKRPRTPHGHKDATTNEKQIRAWWSTWPDANIGVAMRASGLLAIDVDKRGGGLGTIVNLEHAYGRLDRRCRQLTGGGGEHVVFAHPDFEPRGKLGRSVDVKSEGIIVAAPSVHETGTVYEWESFEEPPHLTDRWLAQLRKPEADLADGEEWLVSMGPLPSRDERECHQALLDLGPRGKGKSTTHEAVAIVFHDFGLSVEDGRPYLEWWNGQCGKPHEPEELTRQIERLSSKTRERRRGWRRGMGDFADAVQRFLDRPRVTSACPPLASEVAAVERPPVRTYPSGLPRLDELFGGGIPTRGVTMVVAPTGAGKSGFVLDRLRHVATTSDIPAIYASTELERHECVDRLAALVLGIPHRDIVQGRVDRDEVRAAVAGIPLYVLGREDGLRASSAKGIEILREHVRHVADRHGVAPMLGVDYLQMMVDDDPRHVRMGVTALAYACHDLSQDLDLAALVVSSTGRQFYRPPKDSTEREDPIAYLGAAKESGDVEYACSNLLFLDVASEPLDGVYAARIAVPKARFGERAFVGAHFHGPSGRWTQDDGALVEMSAESRGSKRRERQVEDDDAKMLEAIEKHVGVPWAQLRLKAGMTPTRADRARDRLCGDGRVDIEYGARRRITVRVKGGAS